MNADASQVTFSRDELLIAIRHDCVTFLAFYLQEELTLAVPELHTHIWSQLLEMVDQANQPGMVEVLKKLFAVPREHAKSTLAKLACILLLKYTPFSFCMYVSKTNGHAKNAIRDILMWLMSPQETALHGEFKLVKSSETESLWIGEMWIRSPGQLEPKSKKVIFKAVGAEQQVRGMLVLNLRPQIIVIDDIEDNDNTSPELQPKLDEWFMGALRKSFARAAIVIFLGNMIRKTTLLARLSKDPSWNPTVYGALVRDADGRLQPLWPGRWTVEALLRDYAEYRLIGMGHIWEAEMMNLTHDEILGQDMEGVVRVPLPNPEDILSGCIVLDPAFGQNAWNDDSAFTVHVMIRNVPIPVLVQHVVGKMTEEQMLDTLLDLSYYWGLTTWAIESEAAQKLLISLFSLFMRIRKINETAFLMIPVSSGGKSKPSRILAFRSAVTGGSYGIADTEEEVAIKLSSYNVESAEHDDLCDSAAYGAVIWKLHNETISARGVQQVAMIAHGESSGSSGNRDEFETSAF